MTDGNRDMSMRIGRRLGGIVPSSVSFNPPSSPLQKGETPCLNSHQTPSMGEASAKLQKSLYSDSPLSLDGRGLEPALSEANGVRVNSGE